MSGLANLLNDGSFAARPISYEAEHAEMPVYETCPGASRRIGWVRRTMGGFFRGYSYVGVGLGPFWTEQAAVAWVQRTWASS